jgi:hypothetical protein
MPVSDNAYMVYARAMRKTSSFLVMSLIVSLAIVMMLTDTSSPTGHATAEPSPVSVPQMGSMVVFLLGIIVGGLLIGGYFYVARHEAERDE